MKKKHQQVIHSFNSFKDFLGPGMKISSFKFQDLGNFSGLFRTTVQRMESELKDVVAYLVTYNL